MIRPVSALGAVCALAACAGEAPAPPPALDAGFEQLDPIITALGYEQGISNFCGDAAAEGLSVFLAEAAGLLSAELNALVRARADEIDAEFDDGEEEYICTPEMFEQSKMAADESRADWARLKEGTIG